MQLSELKKRIPEKARISVLGDFSARTVDWQGMFPGNPVKLFLVDDFAIQQLGWVVDEFIAETRPEVCLFTGGTIDAALQIPPVRMTQNLDHIISQLRQAHVEPVLLLSIPIASARPGQRNRLDEIRQAQAAWGLENGVQLVAPDPGMEAVFNPAHIARERVRRILNESVENPRILMLGDSLTEGGGDWNARLGRTDIRNAGQGGYTSGQILWLLQESVLNPSIQTALLTAGINDLSMGLDEMLVYENLLQICGRLHSRGIKVVLQSTIYQHDSPETNAVIRCLNERLERYCRTNAATYFDLNARLAGPAGLKADYTTDGTHLTEGGYAVWADALDESGLMPEDVPLDNLVLPEPARIERR